MQLIEKPRSVLSLGDCIMSDPEAINDEVIEDVEIVPVRSVETESVRFDPIAPFDNFVDGWTATNGCCRVSISGVVMLEDGSYAMNLWLWTGLWWHQRAGREGRIIRLTEKMKKQGRRPGFQKIRNKQRYLYFVPMRPTVVVEPSGEVTWTLAKGDFSFLTEGYVEVHELPKSVCEKFAAAINPILSRMQTGEDSVKRFLDCVLRIPS